MRRSTHAEATGARAGDEARARELARSAFAGPDEPADDAGGLGGRASVTLSAA